MTILTWALVLTLLSTNVGDNDTHQTVSEIGPYHDLSTCEQAGESWISSKIGYKGVYSATYQCKPKDVILNKKGTK